MDAERWRRAKEILGEALELPPERQRELVEHACGVDGELRAEVESLLATARRAGDFLEGPPVTPTLTAPGPAPVFAPQRVGPYRLERELGRGGMGAVYLAVRADDQYQKRVAIKLLRQSLAGDFAVRRFLQERQILATFDHPHIARLLDGGVLEDGLPYIVMEHIDGERLDVHCRRRGLSLRARIELFLKVCDAVQYAHQKLVVHRDIKPGNILVTADGVPKLLDFGIAKLLDPQLFELAPEVTRSDWRLMTPEYASPEQIRGQPITTATDVYSLGVVLYELLSGVHPHRREGASITEVERAICEDEPARPSTVLARSPPATTPRAPGNDAGDSRHRSRLLRGDLDTIVLMALRKEPERRYASAEKLAEDLRRHLDHRPVLARRDSVLYRSAKLCRRHRAAMGAAALVFIALTAGLIERARQVEKAETARVLAERRFGQVRELATSLLFEVHDGIEKLPGATPVRELLVQRALRYLDGLAAEAHSDDSLEAELAAAYLRVGDVQGRPGFPNLGDKAGAIESYRKALAIHRALAARPAATVEAREARCVVEERLSDARRIAGDAAGALEHVESSLAIREALARETGVAAQRQALAKCLQRSGDLLAMTGREAEGLEAQRRALGILDELHAAAPGDAKLRRDLFISHVKLGDRLLASDAAAALGSYRVALAYAAALAAADPLSAQAARERTVCLDKVGNALVQTGDLQGALGPYRESLALRETMRASDPRSAEHRRDLATSHGKVGSTLLLLGDLGGAREAYTRALALDEESAAADPANAQAHADVADDEARLGDILLRAGDAKAAAERYLQALERHETLARSDPSNLDAQLAVARSRARLGKSLEGDAGRREEAIRRYRTALEAWDAAAGRGPLPADESRLRDGAREALGRLEAATGR